MFDRSSSTPLWRCQVCPVIIPTGERTHAVVEHERSHRLTALQMDLLERVGVTEKDMEG